MAGWKTLLDGPAADGLLAAILKAARETPHYLLGQVPHEDQVQYNPTLVVETPTINIDELPLPPCDTRNVSNGSIIDDTSSPKRGSKDTRSPKIPTKDTPSLKTAVATVLSQKTTVRAIQNYRRSRSPEVFDILHNLLENNMCFEGDTNCNNTVSKYANSIGMSI